MLLADSNIWVALAIPPHEFHAPVREWFLRQKRCESILFCRATQHSFLRLLTTASVLAAFKLPPLSNTAAYSTYDRIREDERVAFASEPREMETLWKDLAGGMKASPKLWMDAYLAAFAIVGKYQLVTTDHGFTQFKGLDVEVLRC